MKWPSDVCSNYKFNIMLIEVGKGREITYFCERTGKIFREDIKVCKMYIRKLIYACTIFTTYFQTD